MNKQKRRNQRAKIEQMLYILCFVQLELFLKDIDDKQSDNADVVIGKKLYKLLRKMLNRHSVEVLQGTAELADNILRDTIAPSESFNRVALVIYILSAYKERFKNKIYANKYDFETLNYLYGEFEEVAQKDAEKQEIIDDTNDIAERIYNAITMSKSKREDFI